MALTGSKLAFYTCLASPNTLHSMTSINTGTYVHTAVTSSLIPETETVFEPQFPEIKTNPALVNTALVFERNSLFQLNAFSQLEPAGFNFFVLERSIHVIVPVCSGAESAACD
jgi:hypothetical protein